MVYTKNITVRPEEAAQRPSRRAVQLVYSQEFATREEALASERQIKGWSRKKKETLLQGDWKTLSICVLRDGRCAASSGRTVIFCHVQRHNTIKCSKSYKNIINFSAYCLEVFMGIVKISDELHDAAKLMAKAMSRSINSQAEYWMRIGKLIEENPSITYAEVLKILVNQAVLDNNDYVSEDA